MIWQEGSPHASRDIIRPQDNIILESNWYIHHGFAHQVTLESFRVERAVELAELNSRNRTFFEQYDTEWVKQFDTAEKIVPIIRKKSNQKRYRFSILDESKSLVGSCGFNITPNHLFAIMDYHIDLGKTGNGYARKATSLLIDFVHAHKNIKYFIAYVHDDNLPSQRTVEKLGFAYYMHDETFPEFRVYELHKS